MQAVAWIVTGNHEVVRLAAEQRPTDADVERWGLFDGGIHMSPLWLNQYARNLVTDAAIVELVQAARDGKIATTAQNSNGVRHHLDATTWWQDHTLAERSLLGTGEALSPCWQLPADRLDDEVPPALDSEWRRVRFCAAAVTGEWPPPPPASPARVLAAQRRPAQQRVNDFIAQHYRETFNSGNKTTENAAREACKAHFTPTGLVPSDDQLRVAIRAVPIEQKRERGDRANPARKSGG